MFITNIRRGFDTVLSLCISRWLKFGNESAFLQGIVEFCLKKEFLGRRTICFCRASEDKASELVMVCDISNRDKMEVKISVGLNNCSFLSVELSVKV